MPVVTAVNSPPLSSFRRQYWVSMEGRKWIELYPQSWTASSPGSDGVRGVIRRELLQNQIN